MNNFLIIIVVSFLLSMMTTTASAQKNDSVRLEDFSIGKNEQGDSVKLKFRLIIPPGIAKANEEQILIPTLIDEKGNHIFYLPATHVYGSIRARSVRREKVLNHVKTKDCSVRAISNRKRDTLTYSVSNLPTNAPWIWQAKLVLQRKLKSCCTERELEIIELTAWDRPEECAPAKPPIVEKIILPELPHKSITETLAETERFVEPIENYSAGKKILAGEQEGAQIVYFKLSKAEIDNSYLDNERVLKHIIHVTRQISEDPEVEIAHVVLLGLSSPEGTFDFNKRLSGKRAEALKQYIADRITLPDSCFVLVNGDEGWDELRYKVEHSDMPDRDAVLKIINTVPILKGREGQLMRLNRGIPYRYLEEKFFPELRRAGYIKVYYRMKNEKKQGNNM